MSYDLMLFLPKAAPQREADFFDWFDEQTEWEEDHDYQSDSVSAPALRACFGELSAQFPVLGKKRQSDLEAEYSFGSVIILAAFSFKQQQAALDLAKRLAGKHQLGLFEASSDDGWIWVPDGQGGLRAMR